MSGESVELPDKVTPLKDKDGNLVKPPKHGILDWLPWNRHKMAPIGENSGLIRAQFTVIKPDGTTTPAIKVIDPATLIEKANPDGAA